MFEFVEERWLCVLWASLVKVGFSIHRLRLVLRYSFMSHSPHRPIIVEHRLKLTGSNAVRFGLTHSFNRKNNRERETNFLSFHCHSAVVLHVLVEVINRSIAQVSILRESVYGLVEMDSKNTPVFLLAFF